MDINQTWGSDAVIGPTGDLSMVSGDAELRQRILRRLLTNDAVQGNAYETVVGDYPFHQDYGASIPRRIGQNLQIDEVRSQITAQMLQEQSIAQTPPPTVTVVPFAGGVQCHLEFTSALTGSRQVLEFTVQ